MQRVHRVAVAAGAVLLVAGSGVAVATELRGDGLESADLWAAGEVRGDGLHRFVVSVAGPAAPGRPAASAASPDAGVGVGVDVGVGVTEPLAGSRGLRQRIDVRLLVAAQDEVGAGGRVEAADDGSLRYVLGSRSRVVSAGHASPAAGRDPHPVGRPDTRSGDAAVAALAAAPGVDSAQRLSDGRVLVATTLDARAVGELTGVLEVAESTSLPVAGAVSSTLPGDPLVEHAWFLRNATRPGVDTGALAVWPATRGEGTVVAVVDTGFSRSHPDLAGSVWQNPGEPCGTVDTDGNGKAGDCNGWNFYRNSADVDNGAGGWHGTAVAGAAGARADNGHGAAGIAPGVRLMPLVVGTEGSVDMVLAAEAVRYAADHGADVINLSFGGTASGWVVDHLRAAVRYATDRGVVVVAAAGNDGANRDVGAPVYPASYDEPGMLTVGSSTRDEAIAAHSAYGATKVDLFAPGESIVAPARGGQYSLWNGTSLASPLVAGAVALHAALDPGASPAELVQAVLADASRHPAYAGRSVSGGRLSVAPLGERAAGVQYSFAGAGQQTAGAVQPSVSLRGRAPDGTLSARLALGMRDGGEVLAVSGVDLRAAGASSVTDDDGQVVVGLDRASLATGVRVPMSLDLPTGQYVLLTQALVDGRPVGRPHVAPLTVVDAPVPGEPSPAPSPTGSGPAPTAGPGPTTAGPGGPGGPGG
ncbi:MAG: S8 family serine peptidase, partial [Kineosporiaceae bacterium]